MSGYRYDVFVSFRRLEEWPFWVSEHFTPLLRQWLGEELGREARVFTDDRTEEGAIWPTGLARSLADSAVLVPLLSATYFDSKWCTTEFELMEQREATSGAERLIVPALVHDGDSLPERVKARQARVLSKHVRMRMERAGGTAERLESEIKAWAPRICTAILAAPKQDPSWAHVADAEMQRTFNEPVQEAKPTWAP